MPMRTLALSTLVAALLAAAAVPAIAAGDGFRLGPVTLHPGLTLSETRDDNLGLSSSGKQADWITTVAPSLKLSLPVQRFLLQANARLARVTYADARENNSTDWGAGASIGADFPGGLSFELAEKHDRRYLLPSQEFGGGEHSSLNQLSAKVGYVIRNDFRVELAGSSNHFLFGRSMDRERTETTVQGDFSWRFLPRTRVLVEASRSNYSYDSNKGQDNGATQLALGLSWDVTDRSTGVLKAGWQWKSYKTADAALGRSAADYAVLSGGLRHFFTRRTVAELELSRASQESDFPENPYYLRTAASAGLSQRFTAKIYGRAAIRYVRDEYPHVTTYANPFDAANLSHTGKRADTLTGLTAAAGFDVTRWLNVELGWTAERRNSNFDTFDYTGNRVSLAATAAF